MEIIFSDHAKIQLKRRKISITRVKQTVLKSQSTKSSFRERRLHRRLFGDKLLEVVTRTENVKITVITGYYLK